MTDINKVFGLLRVIAMGASILLSILVVIMSALVMNYTMSGAVAGYAGYFPFAAFAIAISALTLFTVPVMLFISINRKGAFTSMVVVELSWIGLLWVLWLAVGGNVASVPWLNYCPQLYRYPGFQEACMETQAIAAFAFLNWLVLMVLNITLFSLAITHSSRGNGKIWTSYVTEVDFAAPPPNPQVPMEVKGYPQQQQQYSPQQQPQQVQQPYPVQPQQQFAPPSITPSPQPQFSPQPQYSPPPQSQSQFSPSPQPQYVPQAAQV